MSQKNILPFALGVAAGLVAPPAVRAASRLANRSPEMGSCFSSGEKHGVSAPPASHAQKQTTPAAKPAEVQIASTPEAPPVRQRAPPTEVDSAILTLKSARDRALMEMDRADRQCLELLMSAKKYKDAGDDDMARFQMKRRRLVKQRKEDAVKRIDDAEAMIQSVRVQQNAAETVRMMKESTDVLKKFSAIVNVDTVREAKEGFDEQRAGVEEVQALLNEAAMDGVELPSDEEIQAEIDAYDAAVAEEKTSREVAEKQRDSSSDAIDKINSVEPTPDVVPTMPEVEEAPDASPSKTVDGGSAKVPALV